MEVDERQLAETYRPRVLYFALRRLRDRSLAEDVAQETITAVIEALRAGRLRDPSRLGSFILGVAKNLVSQVQRDRLKELKHAANPHSEPWRADTEAELLLKEQIEAMRSAVHQLASQDREILYHCFVEEQALDEIAKKSGISYTAARQRKSRALARLKKIFLKRSQKKRS